MSASPRGTITLPALQERRPTSDRATMRICRAFYDFVVEDAVPGILHPVLDILLAPPGASLYERIGRVVVTLAAVALFLVWTLPLLALPVLAVATLGEWLWRWIAA